ncbi:MAG TPA: tetratricopeptide repeat protein [Pyrinomonadaceae bacterium]|nr:tetratricopeptide repeat protein [Pyrinomonadaceae bacterium]
MRRSICALAGLALCGALAASARAQDHEAEQHVTPDPNTAVIQGRVTLPSGFAAKRYVRITLSTGHSILSTLYTNSSGEFQLRNLSQGVYYVQAEVQDGSFDPATRRVELGRGLTVQLTMELREKTSPAAATARAGARVVSAAELQQSVPPAAKKQYELGLKSVGKGDFAEAAARFEAALSVYPDYLAARNDLGAQYLKLKRLDEAEKQFRTVLERDGKNFNAKYNLGLVHVERRDYAGAIAQLNQAIALDTTRPVARLWLGFALLKMGDVAGAERELVKSLVMGGAECAAANYHLARINLGRGDTAEATRYLGVYLEDAPKGEHAEEARQLQQRIRSEAKSPPRR